MSAPSLYCGSPSRGCLAESTEDTSSGRTPKVRISTEAYYFDRRRRSPQLHETAEKVRASIRRPVSRQHICLDGRSEGGSAAVWRSRFRVDRIVAGEIEFFSGLAQKRT